MEGRLRFAPFRLVSVLFAVFFLVGSAILVEAAEPAPQLLPGFSDQLVVGERLKNSIAAPTSLAFLPDGRMLVASKLGSLHVWKEGATPSVTKVLDIRANVCTNAERGFSGIAVDPKFAQNGYVYVYYTLKTSATCPTSSNGSTIPGLPMNRLSRFTMSNNTVDPASEFVLVDGIVNYIGNHNSGAIRFGPDGYLYLTVGDNGHPQESDDDDSLRGKMLRIDPATGDGVADNPQMSNPQAIRCGDPANPRINQNLPCREFFAKGLRNPFRFAFKPGTSEFYINDVGQSTWEEISVGKLGADYGWDYFEGPCPKKGKELCGPTYPPSTPGKTPPIFWYGHESIDTRPALFKGCNSITGGAFVPPGFWPSEYDNLYLFADYVCGRIWTLKSNGAAEPQAKVFLDNLLANSAVDLLFGPTANGQLALYYTTLNGGGQIHRILYTGSSNRAPTAVATADPTSGTTPLKVTFDATGSADPDGDALTYIWNFGDSSPTVETTALQVTHTYSKAGTYEATLTTRDSKGARSSAPAVIRIDAGDNAPEPKIISPTVSDFYKVGQQVTLEGSGFDPEDGNLSGDSLEWEVILHHNDHTHPFVAPTKGYTLTMTTPPPEDLDATASSYLEIRLTATDSKGLSHTISQAFQPRRVNVTIATEPAGLQLVINSVPVTTPRTIVSWEGYQLNVQAADQTDGSGQMMKFERWLDGGDANRTITTGNATATYTAVFSPPPSPSTERKVFIPFLQDR